MHEALGVSMREELGDRKDVWADSEINGARQIVINETVVEKTIDSKRSSSLFSIGPNVCLFYGRLSISDLIQID